MKTIVIAAAAALSACTNLVPAPDQLHEMKGIASSTCVSSPIYGTAHTATFGGSATGTAGGGGKATCGASVVEFNNEGKAAPTVSNPAARVQ